MCQYTGITAVPKALPGDSNITVMDLSGNLIDRLSAVDFDHYISLTTLSLVHNCISTISEGVVFCQL